MSARAPETLPPPHARLRACVVVPARDEEALVGDCLRALAAQRGVAVDDYEVILVLDACRDATEARAREVAAAHPALRLLLRGGPGRGAGAARRTGMDLACARLLALDRPHGLIAGTDADSIVAPDWLAAQLAAVAAGARAVGGRIELAPADAAALPAGARRTRAAQARRRRARLAGASDGAADHWQFSGASMTLTAEAYARVGGLEPRPALEDEGLQRDLERHGVPIVRSGRVRVTTSGRRHGRAARGLAVDLALADWDARRSYDGARFALRDLLAARTGTISVVVPAREVAATVGAVVAAIAPLREAGLVDELVVVDAGSRDGTADVAAAAGARVVQESELLPEFGPARGKGDAMWRALSATSGDVVAYLDADTHAPTTAFVLGLLGPILADPELALVKGCFARPLRVGGRVLAGEGGRVTELVARPLLNLHAPELAGFAQPLAGEIAARRGLLERLAFPVGYGVELAMLVDAHRLAGLDSLAQVDLGTRQNRHQPLRELSAMAYQVQVAAARRFAGEDAVEALGPGPLALPGADGLEVRSVAVEERPPLLSLHAGPLSVR